MARQRKRSKQTGSLERRGDSYRVRLCVNGKRHTFTVPTTDRAVARKAAEARYKEQREAAARRMLGRPEAVTFSALLEQYENTELPRLAPGAQRSYRNSFVPFRAYFVETLGDPLVTAIRPGDVHGFLAWRRTHRLDGGKGTTSNHTVARDRRVLHRLFEFAAELEHIEANPAAICATGAACRAPQQLPATSGQ
jgi:hypothetical protein